MNEIKFKKQSNCIFAGLYYSKQIKSSIGLVINKARRYTEIPMFENCFKIKYVVNYDVICDSFLIK